ncbi:MAG: type II toxin-antitoxin system RelE/ParE family toxin [bacterium]|nr:type II toxin-antitoxin system RelE/ParE family toxin [Candidatus Limimorpha caballi]
MIDFEQTPTFNRRAKKLAGKYQSFKSDLRELMASLAENPNQGVDLGGSFRKVRLPIKSKGKGKSGGARVITANCIVAENEGRITLVLVYDKCECDNVSLNDIRKAYQQRD